MSKRLKNNFLNLYKFFAIFSLFFQLLYPLLATAVPVYAGADLVAVSADLETPQASESSAMLVEEDKGDEDEGEVEEAEGDEEANGEQQKSIEDTTEEIKDSADKELSAKEEEGKSENSELKDEEESEISGMLTEEPAVPMPSMDLTSFGMLSMMTEDAEEPEIVKLDTYFRKDTYKGISVDIHVNNLSDATKVEVKVEREHGSPVVKINKPDGKVLGTLNTGDKAVTTAPIVIQKGTYDEEGSTSWFKPDATWVHYQTPEKVVVTIERDHGNKQPLIGEVLLAQIGTGQATLEEVMPDPEDSPYPVRAYNYPDDGAILSTSNPKLVWYPLDQTIANSFPDKPRKYDVRYSSSLEGLDSASLINTGVSPYVTLSNLKNGKYFWQMRVKNNAGTKHSDWATPRSFTVNAPVDPNNQHQLTLGGSVYRDHKLNDCYNRSTCLNRAENLGAGWELRLYEEKDGTWEYLQTTQSKDDGKFTFKQLKEAGVYHICEVLKPGWTQQVQTWSGSGYGVNTTNLSGATDEGTYCTTTTYDDSGDRSSKHNFGNVDTTKPITTILGPSDGGFYNGGLITISIKSEDSESGLAQVVANLYRKTEAGSQIHNSCVNKNLDTYPAEHNFECNINVDNLEEGEYFLKTNAHDRGGNVSNTPEWHFTVDDTDPNTPSLVSPENNDVVNGASVTNVWSNIPDAHHYIYESYHDADMNNLRWTEEVAFSQKTAINVADSVFWWRVKAVDTAGNESEWSVLWKVTVDNIAPDTEITNVADGQVLSGSIDIFGTIKDINLSHYWLNIVGPSYSGGPGTVNSGSIDSPTKLFTWNTKDVDDGEYTITLAARDKAGNKDDGSVRWVNVIVDNTAPTSTITPPEGSEVNEDTATLTIIYDTTIPTVSLAISPDNPDGKRSWYITQPTVTLTASDAYIDRIEYQWNSKDGAWTTYTNPLQPGQGRNTLYYRAVDKAGNGLDEIGVKTIQFDKEAPSEVKSFSIDREGKDATVTWEDASDNVGIYRYEIIWELGDKRFSDTVRSNIKEYTIEGLEDGQYEVRVRAIDAAGWEATAGKQGLTIGEGEVAGASTIPEIIGEGIGGAIQFFTDAISGEALSATEEEPQENAATTQAGDENGLVAGVTDSCGFGVYYLPVLLLAGLLILLAVLELFVQTSVVSKTVIAGILVVLTIAANHFLKNDACYSEGSMMSAVSQWCWVMAILLGAVVRLFGSMFVEEG